MKTSIPFHSVRTPLALAMLLVVGSTASAGQTTFQDGTFNTANWSRRTITTGNGGSVSVSQFAGGNPGTSREVRTVNNSGSYVLGLHMGTVPAATFDSGVEFIESIEFGIDALSLSGINGVGHFIGMAITQNGIDYVTPNVVGSIQNQGWRTNSFTFVASNFTRVDGLAGRPDFSAAGAPINFGFFTSDSNGPQFGAIDNRALYDNLRVTFNTELIPTELISKTGNAADPTTGNLYGAVAYAYRIGVTEVTNAQYAVFLNAVADTDTHGLYETTMSGSTGGITRSGAAGSYTYSTVSGRENHPVNHVRYWSACRFANWLHNGQPVGAQDSSTTESGAYELGGVTSPVNAAVTRSANWQWALPNENEWYKAAYYQPADLGGDSDNYWQYGTSSNTLTTAQANFANVIPNTRPVGSYAANFSGVFDMSGNVAEWNESVVGAMARGIRGGSYSAALANQASTFRASSTVSGPVSGLVGFRVVAAAPACDSIDFNGNGVFPEDQDAVDYFTVLAGGACDTGTCNDIDFNNNGVFPEDQDVFDFFNVLAGGNCP